MTPIQEATREWFEMDGWRPSEGDKPHWFVKSDTEPEMLSYAELPTIDANYFFSKVDKQMDKTHALKLERSDSAGGKWVATYIERDKWSMRGCIYCWGEEPHEAGLKAAIAARKEIGR